jgi:hypothetical protein
MSNPAVRRVREPRVDVPRCPRQESNLHPALRRRVLCPLSYEGPALVDAGYAAAAANRQPGEAVSGQLDGPSNSPVGYVSSGLRPFTVATNSPNQEYSHAGLG